MKDWTPSHLVALRGELGWSQRQLAEALRISTAAVAGWEQGGVMRGYLADRLDLFRRGLDTPHGWVMVGESLRLWRLDDVWHFQAGHRYAGVFVLDIDLYVNGEDLRQAIESLS